MTALTDTQVWRHALDQVERLSALAEPERAAALAELRQTSPDLYPRLLTLLGADDGPESATFFGQPGKLNPVAARAFAAGAATEDLAGQELGAYRFVRSIGEGGMGQVWLAERVDGRFQDQIAIKLLSAIGSPALNERFRREGQLLGKLVHPHIARLLDAGALPNGQLYLVLEYVNGERIDRYCDNRRLAIDERLRLFINVCSAVSHAHANLIVHRDLKPSNILVTPDGTVKLLDFGIAKLVEGDGSAEATELTRLAGRAMTPEYAAPEQITGSTITTATDVYALGVILYQLLCGRRPYGEAAFTPAQLASAILEVEPKRPSTRLLDVVVPTAASIETSAQTTVTSDVIATQRHSTSAKLHNTLKGDLDNIVAKALKKQAQERYLSVPALADDLAAYLTHQPVSARPDSFAYRAKKFIRRNQVPVLAGSLAAIAIVAGLLTALWQANIANERRQEADQQAQAALLARKEAEAQSERANRESAETKRQAARAEAALQTARDETARAETNAEAAQKQTRLAEQRAAEAQASRRLADASAQDAKAQSAKATAQSQRAEAVQTFLLDMFAQADPAKARPNLSVRELLDSGQRNLSPKLAGQPDLEATVSGVLGKIYATLGSQAQALPLLERRRALLEASKAENTPEYADTLFELSKVRGQGGAFELAEQYNQRAHELYARLGERYAVQLLEVRRQQAFLLAQQRKTKEEQALLAGLIPDIEKQLGRDNWLMARTKVAYANTFALQGDAARALAIFAEIEPLLATAELPEHKFAAAMVRGNGGVMAWQLGRYGEAERMLKEADRLLSSLVGETNHSSIELRRTLAMTYIDQAKTGEALDVLERNGPTAEQLHGKDHAEAALNQSFRVLALVNAGQPKLAAEVAQTAWDVARSKAGLGDQRSIQRRLALAQLHNGNHAQAIEALEQQLADEKGPALQSLALLYLAGAYAAAGRHADAADAGKRATDAAAPSGAGARLRAAKAGLTRGIALARAGQSDNARIEIDRAEQLFVELQGAQSAWMHFVKLARAEQLRAEGKSVDAQALETTAREQLLSQFGAKVPNPLFVIY